MKNTNIKQIAFIAVMGLFLNACGGSSSSSSDTTLPPVTELKVPSCGTAVDMGKAVAEDVTGKTIKKVVDGEVRIWHSPDATKLACMVSGEALILNN